MQLKGLSFFRDCATVSVEIKGSGCEQAQRLSSLLEKMSMKDLFAPVTRNPVFLAAQGAGCHPSCLIPIAILKAAEVAMNMALQCGADPRMAALLVAVAASNTFILPTHQVNALIMKPGGYQVKDYIRAGIGMTFIFIVVVMSILYFFYGIDA